jgi:hypothetical protein
MSAPLSRPVFIGLSAAATARANFEDALAFEVLYLAASRANDSKTFALEEFELIAGGEPGGGFASVSPFSMKTHTTKSVPLLPRFDGPDGCIFTTLGD